MISPEAQGKFLHGSADAVRVQSVRTYQMDFSGDRTDKKLNAVEGTYAVGISGELGLFKRLDVFILPSIVMSPTIYGLKFQFLGEPKREATKGNFSASVMAGTGGFSQSRKDSNNDLDVIDGSIDEIKMNMSHDDVGLIAGYRWTEKLLHYVNGLYIDEKVDGKVTNNSGTLTNAPFKFHNTAMLYSMGAIYYLKIVYFKLDYSHLITDWSYGGKHVANTLNGGFGFHW